MTPERYQQIDQIFQAALGLESEQRAAYLGEACSGDEKLRLEVESLITSDQVGLSFIDEPAFEMAARVLASDEPALDAGDHIDRYEVVSWLGSGGMGEVYLAHDEKLDRKIALKLLPSHFTQNQERLRRFQQEARAASALNHPNILTIHEMGQVENRNFIATEFVDGETLRERMKRAPLSLHESLDIAIQVCGALAAAHKTGIVHRDIKPENIMLRHDGYVKVLDFGLAKLTEEHKPTTQVQAAENVNVSSGLLMGTVKYMSPEQAQGLQVDARSDIFSFGVVLYEMLAGHAPFEGKTANELIAAILKREPPPLTEAPEEVRRLIAKVLRKKKEKRYQTIEELLVALKSLKEDKTVTSVSAQTAARKIDGSVLTTNETAAISTASTLEYVVSGIRSHFRSITFGLVAIVVVAVAALYFSSSENGKAINSVAILPFVNVNSDPNLDYLSEGIADDLTKSLSRLPGLTVISRSAASRHKILSPQAGPQDVQTVVREFNVDAAVVGKITKEGDRIHISVELVDGHNNSHVWGNQYDRKLSDILNIQEDIAKNISGQLRLLTRQQHNLLTKRYTESNEAYQAYLKGRYFWNKRNEAGMRQAIEQFREAVDLDPTYALAYAGLADTYAILGSAYYDPLPPSADMPKAREAALKALELDDTLAEAHTAMAFVLGWYDWDWPGAERELRRALELQPKYATGHQRYAWYLMAMGRLDEALAEMRLAEQCDPFSSIIRTNVGTVLYTRRQYDDALAQFRAVAEMDSTFNKNLVWPGMAYLEKGAFSEAIAEFKQEKVPWEESVWMLGMTYARMGQKDEARRILNGLQELAKQRYVSPSAFVLIHAALGEKDQAFAWLNKACEERDFDLCMLNVDPKLDSLRGDPRFQKVVERVGLAR